MHKISPTTVSALTAKKYRIKSVRVMTPNVKASFLFGAVKYRLPMPVSQVWVFPSGDSYSICPRCDTTLDREYMRYCDRCGQHLSWKLFRFAKIIHWPRK